MGKIRVRRYIRSDGTRVKSHIRIVQKERHNYHYKHDMKKYSFKGDPSKTTCDVEADKITKALRADGIDSDVYVGVWTVKQDWDTKGNVFPQHYIVGVQTPDGIAFIDSMSDTVSIDPYDCNIDDRYPFINTRTNPEWWKTWWTDDWRKVT